MWLRGPQLLRSAQWWMESGVLVLTRVVLFTTSCVVNSPELCSQQVVLYTLVAVSPVTSHRLPCTATAWSTEKTRHQLPASCLPVSISSIYTLSTHSRYYLHTRYLDRVVVTPLLCSPYSTGWWSRWLYTTLHWHSLMIHTWPAPGIQRTKELSHGAGTRQPFRLTG